MILHALADAARRDILAGLMTADGPQGCFTYSDVGGRSIPKSTLSEHFRVLRDAGLIWSERKGSGLESVPRPDTYGPRFGVLVATIMQAHNEAGRADVQLPTQPATLSAASITKHRKNSASRPRMR